MFIIRVFAENYEKHPHLYDPKEIKQRFDLPVSEVISKECNQTFTHPLDASSRDPFLPVDASESLMNLINGFLRFGVHRVPVKSGHTITSILSQSDVVRYIGKYPKQMEFLVSSSFNCSNAGSVINDCMKLDLTKVLSSASPTTNPSWKPSQQYCTTKSVDYALLTWLLEKLSTISVLQIWKELHKAPSTNWKLLFTKFCCTTQR